MLKTLFTQGATTSRGRLVGLCTVLGLIAVSPDSLPLKAQDASNAPTPTEASKEKAPITRESLIGRWKSVKKGPVGTFIEMEFRDGTFNNGPLGEFIDYSVTEIKGSRVFFSWDQETVNRSFRRTSAAEFLPSGNMLLSWSNFGDAIEFSKVGEPKKMRAPKGKKTPPSPDSDEQSEETRTVSADDLDTLTMQAGRGKLTLNNFNFVIEKAIFGGTKASVQCSVKNKSEREANYSIYIAALDKNGGIVACFCLEPTLNVHEAGKIETLETSGLVESGDKERVASFFIRVLPQRRND